MVHKRTNRSQFNSVTTASVTYCKDAHYSYLSLYLFTTHKRHVHYDIVAVPPDNDFVQEGNFSQSY